jgi:hypothetical protein
MSRGERRRQAGRDRGMEGGRLRFKKDEMIILLSEKI